MTPYQAGPRANGAIVEPANEKGAPRGYTIRWPDTHAMIFTDDAQCLGALLSADIVEPVPSLREQLRRDISFFFAEEGIPSSNRGLVSAIVNSAERVGLFTDE